MLRMGRWLCCYLCCQLKLPIRPLCIKTTKLLVNYHTYKTTNRWHSINAHAKNGAVTVLVSLLPIKTGTTSGMHKTTKLLVKYRTYKITNRWRSVDTYAKNGAVTVLLSLLPIKAANRFVMRKDDQVTGELPQLQNHKVLTLCWHSCGCIVHSTSAAVDYCIHADLTLLVVFLHDWDSALWQSRVA